VGFCSRAACRLAAWVGRPEAVLDADFVLARLLRDIALIKVFLALAAFVILLWRF
jgi:hypothetical protein